ncbi:MAG: 50S ribosomal protein L14 [Candidatus Aenigmarchaeota archaeon]|nr:50S ribosomal protein L14 [Candidatus Aenigmarchaeota archaeon]
MKAVSARIPKALQIMSRIKCADNSGAKELEIIAVKGYKGVQRRNPKAGVGDVVICAVKKGKEKVMHQMVYCVIVRQKKEFRRSDGTRVKFSDNAAVLVNSKTFEPTGTEIRTVIAKEAVERFSMIGKIASLVV